MQPIDEHTHDLIDRYLLGKLEGEELVDFEIKLALDKEFRQEVEFQRILVGSIRNQRRQELKDYIRKNANIEKHNKRGPIAKPAFWQRTWPRVGAGIIVATGLAILLFRNQDFYKKPQEAAKQEYILDSENEQASQEMAGNEQIAQTDSQIAINNTKPDAVFKEEADHTKTLPPADSVRENEILADAESKDNVEEKAEEKYSQPIMHEKSYSLTAPDFKVFKSQDSIKMDILLKDTVLLVSNLTLSQETGNNTLEDINVTNARSRKEEKQEKSLKKGADSKKKSSATDSAKLTETNTANTSSGLPKAPPVNKSIKVEFWQSPINFKGYKYFRNKLYLYGLKPNDEISIFTYNEKLYLKTQKGIFQLLEQNSYNPFVQVKNPELIENFR